MLGMVIQELEISLHRRFTQQNSANKVYLSRFRDLMIGIILNLTCNVENTEVIDYMLKQNVIRMLRKILVDQRHDWPTNGAALALLQFSHTALSNTDIFLMLEEENVFTCIVEFLNVCKNRETKKHLHEASTLIAMSRKKM
jgi:hypothetical protein